MNGLKIPFTNLYQQYLDCKKEIDQAISDTISSSSFITGPDVTKFETIFSNYVGNEDCAGTGSGTMALICALKAVGIGPGDEVLTTPHTFVATSEAIVVVGATPVFVDIDPDTHLIDINLMHSVLTGRTKAVLFVDIYGQCPDMDRMREFCDQHNLWMIEDAAHSIGAKWQDRKIGSLADLTCFSFNPVKNLGAMGDAGCVTGPTNLIENVRKFRDHGRIDRYTIVDIGYNGRIDNIQSNIVCVKLPYLEHWLERKREICNYYNNRLHPYVKTIKQIPGVTQGHYVYVIQTADRNRLKDFLANKGIQTNVHYATTTHLQPAFKSWYRPCPVAEKTVNEILSLPCWYSMTNKQVEYVADSIEEFYKCG